MENTVVHMQARMNEKWETDYGLWRVRLQAVRFWKGVQEALEHRSVIILVKWDVPVLAREEKSPTS